MATRGGRGGQAKPAGQRVMTANNDLDDDSMLNRDASGARAPLQMLPHLYVSNAHTAAAEGFLKREGITVLINLSSKEIPNHFKDDATYTYYNFDIEDEEGFEISQFFRKIYDVIVKVKADGKKALMFDEEGRNVVTTLTIAYMLYSSKKQEKYLPLQKALEFVASKEPSMKPSLDFLQQLCKLEMDLFDECSVRTGGGRGGRGGRGGKRH